MGAVFGGKRRGENLADPYFKIKHLRHAKNDQISQKLLLSQSCPKGGVFSVYCCPLSTVQLVEDVQKLDFPSGPRPRYCIIRCCYDGLVIIGCRHDERCILLLCNPSTGESTVLPDPEFPSIGRSSCLGLGYDSTSGDYKVLQVQPIGRGPSKVLALNSGSWRKIDKHPRGICNYLNFTRSMAFVHEAFHWTGCFGNNFMPPRHVCVATFSISNEVYSELPLPEQIMRGNFAIGISVLKGMLCVHSDSISSAN